MAFDEGFGQVPPSAAFSDDEKPRAPFEGSKEGLVTMSSPMYSKKEVSMAEDEVTVLLEIKAASSAALMREGLDLVAVVDVSGSMKGHKMESAKAALQFVIRKLTPLDRLSIVTFNSSAQRLTPLRSMTDAAKEELKGIVGRLTANGGTDIKSGLVKGLDVLAGRVHTESRTGNIFLMSDGKNDGPSSGDATKVDPGDVVVYTFGFGAGTDHALLAQLAKNSTGGTYNSVPDEANLSTSFALLLGGLVTVVAQDVRVTLDPSRYKKDVMLMTVVDGSDYKHTTDAATGIITIFFGNLFSGEVRKELVHFKLNKNKKSFDFAATLAQAKHSYAAQERAATPMFISVRRSSDPTPPDPTGVHEASVRAEEIRRQVAEDIGKADEMAADKKLPDARDKVVDAMDKIEGIHIDDGDRMIDSFRAALQQFLKHLATQKIYDDLGHSFAISVIISNRRQRAAASGYDVLLVNIFVTQSMQDCVKQAKSFEKNPAEVVPSADDDAKKEIVCNPLAAVSAPIAFNLDEAIRALQAIHKILADANQRQMFC